MAVDMGSVALAVGLAVLGVLLAGFFFYRGGGRRTVLAVRADLESTLDPSTLGVNIEMKVGTRRASNVSILRVTVENKGPRDIEVMDAGDPTRHENRPSACLPDGWRALTDPWAVERLSVGADVRVARSLVDGRQWLFVHIRTLRAGGKVVVRVIATYEGMETPLPVIDSMEFRPGFIADVNVKGKGLLSKSAHATVSV